MTLNKELPALKNGLKESSGFVSESSVKIADMRNRETTQRKHRLTRSTKAKRGSALRGDTAREKGCSRFKIQGIIELFAPGGSKAKLHSHKTFLINSS